LSAHVISVCTRLGVSIQPAQPRKPTDKPTVERFFKTLREGLIQYLPAYKGPDVFSRGEALEDAAFLFVHELEDVIMVVWAEAVCDGFVLRFGLVRCGGGQVRAACRVWPGLV
jgi:hypothetical protein